MLDIKYIRENPSKTAKAAKNKGINVDIDHIIKIDSKFKELSLIIQNLREERNRAAKSQDIEVGKKLKIELEREENALKAVEEELRQWLLKVPNPAKDDVKVGKDDSENEVLRKIGKPRKFDFSPKDHLGLGEKLDIIDVIRASKISGSRFYFLKNEGALLEFALRQLAFDILLKEGFIPLIPPVLIKTEVMKGLGYMENGGDEDMYILDKDDLVLVGTSEQSIVAMHKDEILNAKELPKRYIGFSSCFRREA